MMVKRFVVLLLLMFVVFVGCGEDEPDKVKPKEVVDEGLKKGSYGRDGARMALIPGGSFKYGA